MLFLPSVLVVVAVSLATGETAATTKNERNLQNRIAVEDEAGKFVYYISGFDYENRPVLVLDWGKWNITWLMEHEDQKRAFRRAFEIYVEDLRSGNLIKRVSKNFINETQFSDDIAYIIDFDGLNLRQVQSVEAIKVVIDNLKMVQRYYAQTAYGFVLNANPLVHQVIGMGKPFIGNFLERTEIFGTNSRIWKPQLMKKIPRNQLPPPYGGPSDFKPVYVHRFI